MLRLGHGFGSSSDPYIEEDASVSTINKHVFPSITAFESTHALCSHPTVPHDITIMAQTRKIQLADPRKGGRDLPIEVLIGEDYYWRIVKDASTIRLSSSVVLLSTKFGRILPGNCTGITANQIMVNHIALEQSDSELRTFWDLETIGILPSQEKPLKNYDYQLL
jgi:hypothetical protein